MNHRKVLITLLGRSEKKDGFYRQTVYRFPDGSLSAPVAFFGWELLHRTHPDKVIVLGTGGSNWDGFVDSVAGQDQERFCALIDAAASQQVTQDQLQFFAPLLSQELGAEIELQILSASESQADQLALLTSIAPLIKDGDELILDLTHAFRHLSILLLMAVVYLRSIRSSITVQAVYSSFFDEEKKGVVFDLASLLKLFDWQGALNAFNKDGDPGVFADLLAGDGLEKGALQNLQKASYFSRVHRHEAAWSAERGVANTLERENLSGVSALFAPYLIDKLGSRKESDRALRLARLARKQWELGSYDRAALLGLSAAAARMAQPDEKIEDVHYEIMNGTSKRGTAAMRSAYVLLNGIRNSIAHTNNASTNRAADQALFSEETLRNEMKKIFDLLLAR